MQILIKNQPLVAETLQAVCFWEFFAITSIFLSFDLDHNSNLFSNHIEALGL
ncbi:hypothetical protein HMPREF1054_0677 [Haemophilus paraphrohaemolyticus HK411]|uniref:Uncharacterized protein n=1 Tax=Haemophilus paraphrohaemolyticus HK411 TaxID=1095743 RepID=I2NDB4_9PAST|nr:hypothetical protein HMPREF1054_0677 [Haemophilus paraphrohaemolyticus HK411]